MVGSEKKERSSSAIPYNVPELTVSQPHNRGIIGEDENLVGAPFDLLVQALHQVVALDPAPALIR